MWNFTEVIAEVKKQRISKSIFFEKWPGGDLAGLLCLGILAKSGSGDEG